MIKIEMDYNGQIEITVKSKLIDGKHKQLFLARHKLINYHPKNNPYDHIFDVIPELVKDHCENMKRHVKAGVMTVYNKEKKGLEQIKLSKYYRIKV